MYLLVRCGVGAACCGGGALARRQRRVVAWSGPLPFQPEKSGESDERRDFLVFLPVIKVDWWDRRTAAGNITMITALNFTIFWGVNWARGFLLRSIRYPPGDPYV